MDKSDDTEFSIECDVCMENLKAPISVCETGHSLCLNCRLRLQQCPFCGGAIRSTIRNETLEAVLRLVERGPRRNILTAKTLKCIKCKEIMNGKIGLCDRGHSLCWKCLGPNFECTACNLYKRCSRNFKLEEFLQENLKLKAITDSDENNSSAFSRFPKSMAIAECCLECYKNLHRHILDQHNENWKSIYFGRYFRIKLVNLQETCNMFLKRTVSNIFIINITLKTSRLILRLYQLVGNEKYQFCIKSPQTKQVKTCFSEEYVQLEVGNEYLQKFKTGVNAGNRYVSLIIFRA